VKYACIARYRGEYPVRLMCRVLGVSRAGFYAAQRRAPSARARADQRLRLEIRAIHRATQRRYGAPKIHRGLRAKRSRRFRVTTQSTHRYPIAANQLHRRFAPAAYTERDQVWAADLTYIPTREGWLYLAVVLDLASRRVIGWAVASRLGDELALSALRQALAYRCPLPGALHHSDRGAQYASGAYRQLLAAHGLRCSMSRAGDCWDNAVVESFFATLKTELVADADWPTRAAAHRALSLFIDVWYNHQRRHASLGFLSPVQYERELARLRTA
jgi:transposase InsO family protein